jgi:hypothetical protein
MDAALLATPSHFGAATIVGNLALLQGLYVIDINLPKWSLHYEMLYYYSLSSLSSALIPLLLRVLLWQRHLATLLCIRLFTPPL